MTMKTTRKQIGGRLSLGSYLEVLSIPALTAGLLLMLAGLAYQIPFGWLALQLFYVVVSAIMLGLLSFPAYCWACRTGRVTRLTVVTETKESQHQNPELSPAAVATDEA